MTEVGFYHLTATPLERVLPKLLEKVLESGLRAVILAGSQARIDDLDTKWAGDLTGKQAEKLEQIHEQRIVAGELAGTR